MSAHAVALVATRGVATSERPEHGYVRSLSGFVVDAGLMLGIVFALPLVVLAVGAPIALTLRLVLWLTGTL